MTCVVTLACCHTLLCAITRIHLKGIHVSTTTCCHTLMSHVMSCHAMQHVHHVHTHSVGCICRHDMLCTCILYHSVCYAACTHTCIPHTLYHSCITCHVSHSWMHFQMSCTNVPGFLPLCFGTFACVTHFSAMFVVYARCYAIWLTSVADLASLFGWWHSAQHGEFVTLCDICMLHKSHDCNLDRYEYLASYHSHTDVAPFFSWS